MTGVSRAQLEALAARAPARPSYHPARRVQAESIGDVPNRARQYLRTIPGAVSGERGHDRTFRAACKLVLGFAMTPDTAYSYLAEWNETCSPPWSEYELRRKLEEADKRSGPRGFLLTKEAPPPGAAKAAAAGGPGPCFKNYVWDEISDGETTRKVKRGRSGAEMVEELADYTGGWPRRVGKMLFVRDRTGGIHWIADNSELFAWIDWQYHLDTGRGFEWAAGPGCLTQSQFLDSCQLHCEAWKQVELYPHEPPIPEHYYHHPTLPHDSDGSALTDLVRRFNPATPEDEDLIRLFFITLVWGGPPRKRPIFLFESAAASQGGGRGAGKTTVAVIGSALVGGFVSISPREQLRDMQTRLLSPEALTKRIALIDNLKALRFSDSDIEGLITSPVISGRQLFTGEGQRPNTLTWVVTSNKPSLSKDLAQRSIIIRVVTPTYGPKWERDVTSFIDQHRWRILADCIRELREPSRLPDGFTFSRWAEWEDEVMSKAADPTALASELARRRAQVDDDDEISGAVTEAIRDLVKRKGFDPDKDAVLIPSAVLVSEIVKVFAGEKMTPVSGMRWLYMLGVSRLSKHDTDKPYRGAIWRGDECEEESKFKSWNDRISTTGEPL